MSFHRAPSPRATTAILGAFALFPTVFLLALRGAEPGGASSPPSTHLSSTAPEPWRSGLRFETNEASDAFARLHTESPDDARLALAHASMLLARQPRTQANVETACGVLEKLAVAPLPTGVEPPPRSPTLAARLLLARIAADHLEPPRLEEARARLESLLHDHAGHPLADQAAVDLALLAAFPPPGAAHTLADEIQARIDELRARVRSPDALRELHALQARLHLEHEEPRLALPHLLAAHKIGHLQPDRICESDLSIANIAREVGETVLARRHYEAFLTARPRDARGTTVRRLLAELAPAPAAAPAITVPQAR